MNSGWGAGERYHAYCAVCMWGCGLESSSRGGDG